MRYFAQLKSKFYFYIRSHIRASENFREFQRTSEKQKKDPDEMKFHLNPVFFITEPNLCRVSLSCANVNGLKTTVSLSGIVSYPLAIL